MTSPPLPESPTLQLPSVTLLVVDTRYPELALESMHRSLSRARFARAVLVTRQHWQPTVPTSVQIVHEPGVDSVQAYSMYVLRAAVNHVRTEHALIAQWDSFILDAAAWDNALLDYDYVGAPWPDRPQTPVGNGGFSLRSRRLMRLLADGAVPLRHPEDLCICVDHRAQLEAEHGMRFAPIELAHRFAFELEPASGCFGFHGLFNFHRALTEAELLAWLERVPEEVLHTRSARGLAKGAMLGGHHAAARHIVERRMRGNLSMRLDALKLLARLAIKTAVSRHRIVDA